MYSFSLLMRKTRHWKYYYTFSLNSIQNAIWMEKKQECNPSLSKIPVDVEAEKLGWGLPWPHWVFALQPSSFSLGSVTGIQTTLGVSFATGVLIRVAGKHGACPPSGDPEEKFPLDFRARITGAPPKCELYRQRKSWERLGWEEAYSQTHF